MLKCLALSVVKPSNIALLLQRWMTVLIVVAHYQWIEGLDYWTAALRQNECAFIKLILAWHLVFTNLKVLEEGKRLKYAQQAKALLFVAGLVAIPAAITILTTPVLAWLHARVTLLDTEFWTTRYLMILLYILFNCASSVFPHVHNFIFFLSDGVVLSQLTSLYLYNEFSMSALLTTLPVLFVIQNHLLVIGLARFAEFEAQGKL